jgi:hypothetical protein
VQIPCGRLVLAMQSFWPSNKYKVTTLIVAA